MLLLVIGTWSSLFAVLIRYTACLSECNTTRWSDGVPKRTICSSPANVPAMVRERDCWSRCCCRSRQAFAKESARQVCSNVFLYPSFRACRYVLQTSPTATETSTTSKSSASLRWLHTWTKMGPCKSSMGALLVVFLRGQAWQYERAVKTKTLARSPDQNKD